MLITIICVLLLIDLLVFTTWDRYILSFFILIAGVAGLYFLVPEVQAVLTVENWRDIAMYGIAYLLIGMAVAAGKWVLHVFKIGRFLTKCKESFVYRGEDPAMRNTAFIRHVKDQPYCAAYRVDDYTQPRIVRTSVSHAISATEPITDDHLLDILTPKVGDYTTRVTFWVFQWPFVVLSLLLEDILMRFGEWVSDFLGVVFGRFTKYIVRNAIKGL